MWYRLSQGTQQTNDSQNIVSNFNNNITTILDKYSGNISLMGFKLADLARNTILPMGHDKSSLISQAIKSKNGDSGYPIEQSYNYYMSNSTAVPESALKEQQTQTQTQTPGSDTQGNMNNPGFQPMYDIGPDGNPIVKGFKYDGSKQTPKPTWNPVSIQAAFEESKVQFVMGGASQDHRITEQKKQEILNYLKTNKNKKNILLPEKLAGLNIILNSVGHKADTNDSGGILFVERA